MKHKRSWRRRRSRRRTSWQWIWWELEARLCVYYSRGWYSTCSQRLRDFVMSRARRASMIFRLNSIVLRSWCHQAELFMISKSTDRACMHRHDAIPIPDDVTFQGINHWSQEWIFNVKVFMKISWSIFFPPINHFKVDHLNVGVAQAYLNQKRLDQEAKNLNTNANNFNKQTQQWLSLIESFTSSLKVRR